MIHDEMIMLVMVESIFSIVPIRKCCRTSVLVHGTKCARSVGFTQSGSISGISVVWMFENIFVNDESRTCVSGFVNRSLGYNDGEDQLSCVSVWF